MDPLSGRCVSRVGFIAATLLAAIVFIVGGARGDSGTSGKGAAQSGNPADFWTPERMRGAKPIQPSPRPGWAPKPANNHSHAPSIASPGSPPTAATHPNE